jgi:putative flippase GtrA
MKFNYSRQNMLQFARFSLIGAMNGALDIIILNLLLQLWQHANTWDLILANSLAYSVAVLNSYVWNARLTFRRESTFNAREKALFAAQALVSLLISNGVFLLFLYLLGLSPLPLWLVQNGAKGLSMALSSLSSFFFMKVYVFKGKREREADSPS